MEWLKEVDLAEYAPNLRGSGVHGALILYEPRFDDVLLADLLSIPANKTLLRRHLSIHFKEEHGGVAQEILFRVLSRHIFPLERQVQESLNILRASKNP